MRGAENPQPQVLRAIVGTAGHVDHGKTSLVKLLTGYDSDRLPEEKARGMSIDLAFVPCRLGSRLIGVVDVPGHQDFIRNMVAGIASVDILLLVVAADDGIMPQTREHMKIVGLLRRPQVLVALTKTDLVSPEQVDLAREEIAAFLAHVGFPDAPVLPVSNKTGEGVDAVRDTIGKLVDRLVPRTGAAEHAFRMNVVRVFSAKGHGTVVAGVPLSGTAGNDEKLELLPPGLGLTVRAVQVYRTDSQEAFAGASCAMNVRNVEPDQITRGMTIASPGIFRATTELVVALENASEGREEAPFRNRFDVRLHIGTSATMASVKLLGARSLPAGTGGFAHLELAEPLVAAAGDRFILRSPTPGMTVGGGTVLSARPQRFRRIAGHEARLAAARDAVRGEDVLASELLAGPEALLAGPEAARLTQRAGQGARQALAEAVSRGVLVELSVSEGGGEFAVPSRIDEIRDRLLKVLARHHRADPYGEGMPAPKACAALGISARGFDRLAPLLVQAGTLALRHGKLALASFRPDIPSRLLLLRAKLLALIERSGAKAPARGNLMREFGILETDMKILEKILCGDGSVLVLDGHFMHRSAYEACRQKLLELFKQGPTVEWKPFKDAIGTNRDMAVAVLDAFDAEGLTRRTPAGRVLLKGPPQ